MGEHGTPTFAPTPATMEAAARLRRHAEWSEGFWLGYVFTASPPQVHLVQDQLGRWLEEQGSAQRVLRPRTPDELERVLAAVLSDEDAKCTWVEAIRERSLLRDAEAWSDAWVRFVLRTNERRELLREKLHGGVILVAHPDLKADLLRAGPDLWSIRSVVLELPSGTRIGDEDSGDHVEHPMMSDPAPFVDSELLDSDLRRLPEALAGQEPSARAHIKQMLAMRLFTSNRYVEAAELARDVVAAYRELVAREPDWFLRESLANALEWLGLISSALGRHEDAVAAVHEAVQLGRRWAEEQPDQFRGLLADALDHLGQVLSASGRHEDALAAGHEAVQISRQLAEESGSYGLLAVALDDLGQILSAVGRHEDALAVAFEAVQLGRQLAGERPDQFRGSLARSLDHLGGILGALGRHEDALAATQEARALWLPGQRA